MEEEDYQIAKENEEVFRNILRDLKKRNAMFVPKDLKTELRLDELFEMYSEGDRYGKFTITSFSKPKKTEAIIEYKNVACMSGGGAELKYLVNEDNSVKFKKCIDSFMS